MRFFCAFFLAVFTTTNLFAQDFSSQSSDETLAPDPSQEIWNKKDGGTYEQTTYTSLQTGKIRPLNPSPIPTPAPIDGGLVVLIAAGALYGKRKLDQNKRSRQ